MARACTSPAGRITVVVVGPAVGRGTFLLGRAGSGSFADLWGNFYEIRRRDNDPGKATP